MSDPQIEKLLNVQTCDIKLQKTELDLARLPKERAAYHSKIESERAGIEEARQSLAALEVKRKEMESQTKTLESEIQRFRNQQLEVKKNEEYRALTAQIEQAQATISQLEEGEIELMFEIDTAKSTFEEEKKQIEDRICEQEKLISLLKEKELSLSQSLELAREEYNRARMEADTEYLEQYDRVRKLVKRAPYLVVIKSQKCDGCHLRVSNEVSRAAATGGEPHFCDQCARMVYA